MASHLRCWRIGGATSFPCGLYGLYGLCCVNTWPLHIFLSGSCNACRFYMKKTSQSPPSRFGFKLFLQCRHTMITKHAVLRVRWWCFRGRFCRRIRGLFRLLRICLRVGLKIYVVSPLRLAAWGCSFFRSTFLEFNAFQHEVKTSLCLFGKTELWFMLYADSKNRVSNDYPKGKVWPVSNPMSIFSQLSSLNSKWLRSLRLIFFVDGHLNRRLKTSKIHPTRLCRHNMQGL